VIKVWGSTPRGSLLTASKAWTLALERDDVVIDVAGTVHQANVAEFDAVNVERGVIWAAVTLALSGRAALLLDGIPNGEAQDMAAVLAEARQQALDREHLRRLHARLDCTVGPIVAWFEHCRTVCTTQLKTRGWLTQDFIAALEATKPRQPLKLFSRPDVVQALQSRDRRERDAVAFWQQGLPPAARSTNQRHLERELLASKAFFDTVEKTPLTPEQARAVMCFDSRVLLVASAGSGKTSTLVAKAAYAMMKGYFAPERILMLAFNREAAAELGQRVENRFGRMGLVTGKVATRTFHAFGLEVIGMATGRRPALAPWLENGRDLEALLALVDTLKDTDPGFRANWDLFRLVLAQEVPKPGEDAELADTRHPRTRQPGFWTLNGETVKSRGEQLIANWLFYNGVEYEYEPRYKAGAADGRLRYYRPNFYLPAIDAYLEHWAPDHGGRSPEPLESCEATMAWKRQAHRAHGTTLLETTVAQLWDGEAFSYLARELTQRGVELDPHPDRPVRGRKPIENPRLARTFRSFLAHAKSNRMTTAGIRAQLESGAAGRFRYRHSVFLMLFERIRDAWQQRLKAEGCIDYEDMLNIASDCIEQGRWKSPYELVMVDEFQDASQARARLVASLVREPGRCLFAVGDDWQGINRFAGADLGVMTGFEARFGPAQVLRLETTFRCPQSLCDVSSRFVMQNPKQLPKRVVSAKADVAHPVRVVSVDNERQIAAAVAACIEQLRALPSGARAESSILVLGRYNSDRRYLPARTGQGGGAGVDFMTVHSSKGREADHVILPCMTCGALGFPSRVADDPVLRLAMPQGDDFELAEERRLFYVALTRARSTVTLITVAGKESSFLIELVNAHRLPVTAADGSASGSAGSEVCPRCGTGVLVNRESQHGPFQGCSTYPACNFTRDRAARAPVARSASSDACRNFQ
jgi:DNA helicase-4